MSIFAYLIELKEQDIIICYIDGKLSIKGPSSKITKGLKLEIKAKKEQVVELLTNLKITSNQMLAPTTIQQQRLWIIDQLQSGSAYFNIQKNILLKGDLNYLGIENAFKTIVQRHSILRTQFHSDGELPYQVTVPNVEFELIWEDFSELSSIAQGQMQAKVIAEESKYCFVLNKSIMLRVKIIKLSSSEHILIYNIHHIAADGWSLGVLTRELSTVYNGYCAQEPIVLTDLKIQYSDFAHWQKKILGEDKVSSSLGYWTEKLKGIPVLHNLPTDFSRPAVQTYEGGIVESLIKNSEINPFKSLCIENGVTLFMGLYATFSLLLSRFSNERDIVIGTSIANRERSEVYDLIGFFVNTLVLRSDLDKPKCFIQLLEQCKKDALDSYANQHVPFEQLIQELKLENNASHSPIFQIMLILHNEEVGVDLNGLKVTELTNKSVTQSKYEITLNASMTDDGLKLSWEYNAGLFSRNTLENMSICFSRFISLAVKSPNTDLDNYPIIEGDPKTNISLVCNNIQSENIGLHNHFEQASKKYNHQIAVIEGEAEITYLELNRQANLLAHYLIDHGIKPNDVIGICLPRSILNIVSIIAVLKVGAAYLPIDTSNAPSRIAYMCENSSVKLVVSQSLLSSLIPKSVVQLKIDSKHAIFNGDHCEDITIILPGEIKDQPACIIYTSGTTGRPKGVVLSHGNISSYTQAVIEEYELDRDDRFLQFSNLSFDIFIEELFPTLHSGASLVLRNDKVISDVDYFWSFLEINSISVVSLPTAFWHNLCSHLKPEHNTNTTRLFICGGETMSSSMLSRWQKMVKSDTKVLNTYGPTECTVIATKYDATHHNTAIPIPIGMPIDNSYCLVLDNNNNVCPIGTPGELYIGGSGVSKGYLGQDILTNKAFIKNPFNESLGRLYKTGDIVRQTVSGNMLFCGRLDNQVKIRGYRVEINEIEYYLEDHNDVESSVIIVESDSFENQRIIAYISKVQESILSEQEIINDLELSMKGDLPNYMWPAVIIPMQSFSLTENGKIDKSALPKANDFIVQEPCHPLLGEVELLVAEIWADLLKVNSSRIEPNSNFFALGGHSLLVIQLIKEIEVKLSISVDLQTIFDTKSFRELTTIISNLKLVKEISFIDTNEILSEGVL